MVCIFLARPIYPSEDGGGEDGEVEDEAELTLDKVEEEMMAEFDQSDDEEEENILHMDDLKNLNKQRVRLCQVMRMSNQDSI